MRWHPLAALLPFLLLAGSCQFRHRPFNLEEKLDSIRKLEEAERLRESMPKHQAGLNPFKDFYDGLDIQPLPVRYTKEYVRFCDNFVRVPESLVLMLELEGRTETRAAALPENERVRLMMVAGFDSGGIVEIWLYSLNEDYLPVDKMCLFDIADEGDESYFAITSDYDIYRNHVLYTVDDDGMFQEVIVNEPEDDGMF